MKLTTKYLLALITTLLLLNLSVAEALRYTVPAGRAGATGPQGPQGLQGPQGPAGVDVPVHIVGESYQGGIIFWVDPDGQHGLIAARADQSSGIQWYNGTYFATNATADGIYAGAKNTEVIISTQTNVGLACTATSPPSYCSSPTSTAPYAALVAANYSIQDDGVTPCTSGHTEICWGDWYLPSKVELRLMYYNIGNGASGSMKNFRSFSWGAYWSSTERVYDQAWSVDFSYDEGNYHDLKNVILNKVCAIRAF